MGKKPKSRKRQHSKIEIVPKDENEPLPAIRNSDEPAPKKEKWINRQRVLVFAARGINHRDRHLMRDLRILMPHHKAEAKMERSKTLSVINELCEFKNCNKALLFEGRRKQDLYMWIANIECGPSIKFLIENIHTMGELKMTGNCLKGSRPLLSFDESFQEEPHYQLIQEHLTQIFGVPNRHPRSQPFFDNVYTFSIVDKRIWFRNFQILSEDGGLAEIGPRFVMNPIKIFDRSFGGEAIWENPDYVSPAKYRQMLRKKGQFKYVNRVEQKAHHAATRPDKSYAHDEMDDIFDGDTMETAEAIAVVEGQTKKKVKKRDRIVSNASTIRNSNILRKVEKLVKQRKEKALVLRRNKALHK